VELLQIWKTTNTTIVMISHHFEEAVLLSDRIGVMQDGTLKDVIPVMLPRPRTEEQAQFLMEVKKVRACLA
jgi:NitT/TauT family transport system ATP-binding protein